MWKKIIITIICLSIVIVFVIQQKQVLKNSSQSSDEFAVQDTLSICQIFLVDKHNHHVTLIKHSNNVWFVNDSTEADQTKINIILQTLHDIQVLRPITDGEQNRVVALLSSEGVKVECYNANKDRIKTIYVGPGTADNLGTYMLVEGANMPCVTHIPGFVGYLSPRFFTDKIIWQSKKVFDSKAENIIELEVNYPKTKSDGFVIKSNKLYDINGIEQTIDKGKLGYYLSSFQHLYFEGYKSELDTKIRDSIRNLIPYCIVKLKAKGAEDRTLYLFEKKTDQSTMQQFDEKGNPIMIDKERYYGFKDNDANLFIVQTFNFGRILKKKKDFE